MLKLKLGTIIPTPEEDRIITAAAESGPDNPPLKDEDLAAFKRARAARSAATRKNR